VFIVLPAFFILYIVLKFPSGYFTGGWNFVSLFDSFWEQMTGVMIMVLLLSFAKFKWNKPSIFLDKLSGDAFGVYVFHPLFVIGMSLLLQLWSVDPAVKLLVAAPSAVVLSFFLVGLLRKIKAVRSII